MKMAMSFLPIILFISPSWSRANVGVGQLMNATKLKKMVHGKEEEPSMVKVLSAANLPKKQPHSMWIPAGLAFWIKHEYKSLV